jgi:putative ABC transport system ATP-binding protein
VVHLIRDLVMRSGCGLLMVTHSARLAAMLDRRLHLSGGLLA